MIRFTGKTAKFVVVFTITMLLLTVSAFAAEGEIAVSTGTTTGAGLRVRSEPTTEASVVTRLEKGVTVAVLEGSTEGWYAVSYNGKTGFVSAEYLEVNEGTECKSYGRVNGQGVNLRDSASTEGVVTASLNEGDVMDVTGLVDGWYSVTSDTYGSGYVRSDFLDLTNSKSSGGNSGIVDIANQYLGVRYVYGGASPSGFDCSGFTMYVYKKAGYSLPHSATSQWQSGLGTRVYSMSELQPGDLVFFNDPARNAGKACSHVGIYAGNGQLIHSSSTRSKGVIYSDLATAYYTQFFVGGIHVG